MSRSYVSELRRLEVTLVRRSVLRIGVEWCVLHGCIGEGRRNGVRSVLQFAVSYLMCARLSRVCVPCVNVNTTNATTGATACVSRVRPDSPRCLFTGTGAAASVVALTSGMCVVGGFGWL
jgi:hypothetical protein